MNAVTVIIMGDQIGSAKFSVDKTFFHILFGECEGKFAADSIADRQPAFYACSDALFLHDTIHQ